MEEHLSLCLILTVQYALFCNKDSFGSHSAFVKIIYKCYEKVKPSSYQLCETGLKL